MKLNFWHLLSLISCIFGAVICLQFIHPHSIEDEQVNLTKQLVESLNNALLDTQKNVKIFVNVLKLEFDLNKSCNLPPENNFISSIYYPKSAIHSHRTDCFVSASKKLEPLWQKFYQESGYISWIYTFDSDSKVKRILPAGNVKTLFGENLIFDSFFFYQNAVLAYPSIGWTKVREDISGTGKIIIPTQALKLPSSKKFVSMSADIRINQILKNKYPEIKTFLQKKDFIHFFIFVYSKEKKGYNAIANFSNDFTLWMPIKPHDNRILNVLSNEEASLSSLESLSNSNPLSIKKNYLTIQGEKYFCSQGRVAVVPIFFLVCSRS